MKYQAGIGLAALSAAMAGALSSAMAMPRMCQPSRMRHLRRNTNRANPAGSKLARQAEAGTLTMRAPGGVVSQLYRELQQRKFKH